MSAPETLPVYWATLDDDAHGLSFVSLVDKPAIERNFVALAAARRPVVCAVANEDKRLVYGPILRADFPIYRKDRDRGEYYIAFSAEVIRRTVEKFFADKQVGNVNVMHEAGSQVDGVHLVQLFIKNTAAGINPAGFEEIEEGSLFGEYHVTDDGIWAAIKAGEFRGFSIEGNFSLHTQTQQFKPQNTAAMNAFDRMKATLSKVLVNMAAVTTDKGPLFWDGDDDLKAGDAVYIEDDKGERKPAPDGDYTTEDGKTIKVTDGKVAQIVDPRAEVGAKEAEGTDNGADPKRLDKIEKRLDDIEALLEKIVIAPAMQFANLYLFCGNNPAYYIDPDGRIFWLIPVIAGLVAGVTNVVANWKIIDGFWQGFTTFFVGAGAGVAAAFTGGSGIGVMMGVGALSGATVLMSNSIVAQTGNNFSGFNSINWGAVGKQTMSGAIGGGLAAGAGRHVGLCLRWLRLVTLVCSARGNRTHGSCCSRGARRNC